MEKKVVRIRKYEIGGKIRRMKEKIQVFFE